MSEDYKITFRDLEDMSVDDAQDVHMVLDALEAQKSFDRG